MKAIYLTLIAHAATAAQRLGCFPADSDDVCDMVLQPPHEMEAFEALTGPELRACKTAHLLGLTSTIEPALRECDFGRWKGASLKELQENEPTLLREWLTDPYFSTHGGESFADVCQRVTRWLDNLLLQGPQIAVTHPMIIRAAMMHGLQISLDTFHRLDVLPLSRLHLSRRGSWRVRLVADQ
ncbi:broad specificity phosphatase PhoE [Pseudomonas oryzihabitans]